LATWVEGIEETFTAAAGAGLIEQRIRIGGKVIRLQSTDAAMLEQLARAFSHLRDESGEDPALTVSLWDSKTSRIDPPPLPKTDENDPRGAVYYSAEPPLQVAYQPGLSLLSALDARRASAWFWCASATDLPFWEPAAPIRQILHWWLAEQGLMLLHGAAVGTTEGGVLLVGRGGSGKSTCALASLASDLLFAGDDYVAACETPNPWIYSLYSSGKLVPDHARLLPHLPPPSFDGDGSEEEKAVFFVHDRFPGHTCEGFPLRAVLVPRVAGTEPRILPLEPGGALRALAPSTLLQLHPARPEAMASMARLLQRVPTFAFEVGGDIDEIPKAIERFLRDLPA
jgi:hypothetical protein